MNIFSFKNSGDERLDLQKYKAGYYAFWTMWVLSGIITILTSNSIDIDKNPAVLWMALPLFLGIFIYETMALEYLEYSEEQKLKNDAGRRRFVRSMIIRLTLVFVFSCVTNYYFVSEQKSVRGSLLYGCFFTLVMGGILYSEYRSKVNKIKRNDL
ncbi:MAG: hypothetical protein V4642_04010 [Bacteroidota bacterium]